MHSSSRFPCFPSSAAPTAAFVALLLVAATGCSSDRSDRIATGGGDGGGPSHLEEARGAFRQATLGLDRFWSDAVGLDEGLASAEFTTLDALRLGMQIDAAAMGIADLDALLDEFGGDLDSGALLGDPAFFERLVYSGAIMGLVAVDVDGSNSLDFDGADRVGLSCSLCHSVVDGALYDGPTANAGDASMPVGSIGVRVDGPAPADLRLGSLFAVASNSAALYPYMPQSHATIGGEPIGRTDDFADTDLTEAEADALLRDSAVFPAGLWDTTPDGIGNPTVMPPVYNIRPAAPYGIAGDFPELIDALNAHVTLGLDPTTLLTPSGAQFMDRIALGIGTEMTNEYEDILTRTGVMTPAGGFPFVDALDTGQIGAQASPSGYRVDDRDLRLLAIYLQELREPSPPAGNPSSRQRGELTYGRDCASCHGPLGGVNPHGLVPLTELRAAYLPTTLLLRGFPYSYVLDDRLSTYDDRLVIFDRVYAATQVPSLARSISSPHLTGLHLRSMFLHDGSVPSLEALLDDARGAGSPHPFYVVPSERADLIEFLETR